MEMMHAFYVWLDQWPFFDYAVAWAAFFWIMLWAIEHGPGRAGGA